MHSAERFVNHPIDRVPRLSPGDVALSRSEADRENGDLYAGPGLALILRGADCGRVSNSYPVMSITGANWHGRYGPRRRETASAGATSRRTCRVARMTTY